MIFFKDRTIDKNYLIRHYLAYRVLIVSTLGLVICYSSLVIMVIVTLGIEYIGLL